MQAESLLAGWGGGRGCRALSAEGHISACFTPARQSWPPRSCLRPAASPRKPTPAPALGRLCFLGRQLGCDALGNRAPGSPNCTAPVHTRASGSSHWLPTDTDDYTHEGYDSDGYDCPEADGQRLLHKGFLASTPGEAPTQGAASHSQNSGSRTAAKVERHSATAPTLQLPLIWALYLIGSALRCVAAVGCETSAAVRATLGAAGSLAIGAGLQAAEAAGLRTQAMRDAAAASPAAQAAAGATAHLEALAAELPEGVWPKIMWLWDRPRVKQLRITVTAAQWTVRLPALLALVGTQVGILAGQVSLPMLAPLLLGTGMLLRSIRANASFLFPRIGVVVILLWALWFANSVIQSTVVYLRRQGGLDGRVAGAIVTTSECGTLLVALVIVLSMLGVNISGLLLPTAAALAFAAKDLTHNFLAGFFLFAVQPFKLGDRVAVAFSSPAAATGPRAAGWFEGVCEKVDLRYTVVRAGPRRLFVPNSAFLTREFIVHDDPTRPRRTRNLVGGALAGAGPPPQGAGAATSPGGAPPGWMVGPLPGYDYDPAFYAPRPASSAAACARCPWPGAPEEHGAPSGSGPAKQAPGANGPDSGVGEPSDGSAGLATRMPADTGTAATGGRVNGYGTMARSMVYPEPPDHWRMAYGYPPHWGQPYGYTAMLEYPPSGQEGSPVMRRSIQKAHLHSVVMQQDFQKRTSAHTL